MTRLLPGTLAVALLLLAICAIPVVSARAALIGVNYQGTVVTIDPVSIEAVEVGDTGVPTLNSLARVGDRLISASFETSELIQIDPATYELVDRGVLDLDGVQVDVRSLASRGGLLVAANFTDAGLYSIDLGALTGSRIGTLGTGFQAMDFAPDGVLFGWHTFIGLVRIDVTNASFVDVNPDVGGFGQPILQSLAFVPGGELLGVSTNAIYSIDRETGIPIHLGNIADVDLRGIVPVPEASSLALLGVALGMLSLRSAALPPRTAATTDRRPPGAGCT